MSHKILVVLTSNDKLIGSDHKTGYYLPEIAHPYYVFKKAGIELVAASEKGGAPPLDQSSVEAFKDDPESKQFLNDAEAQRWINNTIPLSQVNPPASEFAAIFYPGGHGPLIGLPENKTSQELIRSFFESKRVVSAVCHAPAVFTEVKLSDGSYILNGRQATAFTNEEEEQAGLTKNVPWLVETRMGERGAQFQKGKPWTENVVVDKDSQGRILITGANPQSGGRLAKEVLNALGL